MSKTYAVYLVASKRNGTGVTSELPSRIWQHRNGALEGFTKKHKVHLFVLYEFHADVYAAIAREKQIKGWNRTWKNRLIEKENSGWNDLSSSILG